MINFKNNDDNLEGSSISPKAIRLKQYYTALISLIALILAVVLFIKGPEDKKSNQISSKDRKKSSITISDLTSGAKAEDRWLQISEKRLQELESVIKRGEASNKELKEKLEKIAADQKENKENLENTNQKFDDSELLELKNELLALKDKAVSAPSNNSVSSTSVNDDPFSTIGKVNKDNSGSVTRSFAPKQIEEINISGLSKQRDLRDIKNYLPAASFAPAKVIEGVDASVGIDSQSDPRPIKFIVTGPAISSYHKGVAQTTDITGCIVYGAARGDLSSEKVYARLIKMTCAPEPGKSVTMLVQGHTAGQGKAGIRGPIVSREGDLVTKSFLAGVAGGLGKGASQYFTTPGSIMGSQITTQKPSSSDILGKGLGEGFSEAGSNISEYFIKRAEQYQPVVTISGGIDVELNFDEGVYIDGTSEIKEVKNANNK
jgi:conjugal transfer pilus assembly protein TraB